MRAEIVKARYDWLLKQRYGAMRFTSYQSPEDTDGERYLLVEKSSIDLSLYATLHRTLEDAGEYRISQEYPEDWVCLEVVDLLTGQILYEEPAPPTYEILPSDIVEFPT